MDANCPKINKKKIRLEIYSFSFGEENL